jgi:hypothetical protein
MQANKRTAQKGVKHEIRAGVLGKICMQLLGGGPHSRRLIVGQVETNVEVYNELDSEDKN